MIDTHAHIYLEQFEVDLPEVMDRCEEAGVNRILMPNIDHTSIESMMEVELRYPGICEAMIGLHPCSVDKHFERALYQVEDWLNKRTFIAIGEIGTDLYWDKSNYQYQQEAFKIQVKWAFDRKLPVVIHCRESMDETLDLLEPLIQPESKGVFHCFSGSKKQAEKAIDMGMYLGIGGVVTFKNSGLDEVMKEIDPEHVVLETDSPYLAPVPYRGKRNEPGYVLEVRDKLSDVYQKSVEDIDRLTTKNAINLFNLNDEISGNKAQSGNGT